MYRSNEETKIIANKYFHNVSNLKSPIRCYLMRVTKSKELLQNNYVQIFVLGSVFYKNIILTWKTC